MFALVLIALCESDDRGGQTELNCMFSVVRYEKENETGRAILILFISHAACRRTAGISFKWTNIARLLLFKEPAALIFVSRSLTTRPRSVADAAWCLTRLINARCLVGRQIVTESF